MPVAKKKRHKVANTVNTIFLEAHSEEALTRIWQLCQDSEALKHVDPRTVIKANVYLPLTDVTQVGDGKWTAQFIIKRDNVRGNWKSDVTRVVQAAIGISGLQASQYIETVRTEVAE